MTLAELGQGIVLPPLLVMVLHCELGQGIDIIMGQCRSMICKWSANSHCPHVNPTSLVECEHVHTHTHTYSNSKCPCERESAG